MADSDKHAFTIQGIEALTQLPVPRSVRELDERDLEAVADYLERVLQRERAGMDGLFQSMSQTMKYIPRFLLQSLAQKFIEPPIAARITTHLSLKQSVGIAAGLPAAYIADSALYLEPAFAAEFICALPAKHRANCWEALAQRHPMLTLSLLVHVEERLLKKLPISAVLSLSESEMDESQLRMFSSLKAAIG